ncbi:hypothetical protein Q5741_09465 [Paenibacillus sp. JX-17]|uniref:DUF4870 domain-containing protein n=1 Tax=Paenibacillus lacisoli TaxID=3064525 RepID=A0ABT9CBL1_9BACL|nr:hypothetical protein [Paenibacillus sp. JX-17]MDO7906648.1 hypothetical protein [Paenibacillus sp. JX-17]
MSPFKSSTGLNDNVASMLCYLFLFAGALFFLVVEKRSRFVLFHALQSLLAFGVIVAGHVLAGFVPFVGPLLASMLSLATILIWLFLALQALQGKWTTVPWIGEIALKQSRNL